MGLHSLDIPQMVKSKCTKLRPCRKTGVMGNKDTCYLVQKNCVGINWNAVGIPDWKLS